MTYSYYYNHVPGQAPSRNNLVYTSLMSDDMKTFVQWYYNDPEYHQQENEVVDPELMKEKWSRELCWLNHMSTFYPDLVPKIKDIDLIKKKIYLEVDGLDFWNRAGCDQTNYDQVLPDWQDQMLNIIRVHKQAGLYKYSMHPSSYFIVDGKLKSINYFFCYHKDEPEFSISDVSSHIHSNRQNEMRKHIAKLGIDWNSPQPLNKLQDLCFESFRINYPDEFIDRAKEIYHD